MVSGTGLRDGGTNWDKRRAGATSPALRLCWAIEGFDPPGFVIRTEPSIGLSALFPAPPTVGEEDRAQPHRGPIQRPFHAYRM